uniref:Uncharacterized protein n=1 Tax=Rhizophora mucronata TaxID=61149 RepID=A0A2P2JM70_RHIMU
MCCLPFVFRKRLFLRLEPVTLGQSNLTITPKLARVYTVNNEAPEWQEP